MVKTYLLSYTRPYMFRSGLSIFKVIRMIHILINRYPAERSTLVLIHLLMPKNLISSFLMLTTYMSGFSSPTSSTAELLSLQNTIFFAFMELKIRCNNLKSLRQNSILSLLNTLHPPYFSIILHFVCASKVASPFKVLLT